MGNWITKKGKIVAKKKEVVQPVETFYPSEIVDIDSIKPWPTNYNDHPDQQLQYLRGSLRDFGQVKNVIIWGDYIVAGHGLVEAARGRGWRRVEVKRLPAEWSETQVEAVLIADNRLAQLSTANDEKLADMLQRVRQGNNTLLDSVGYNSDEVDTMLRKIVQDGEPAVGAAEPQIDRAAELQEHWQVKTGDTWRIGDHVVICGDCREPDTWQRLLNAANVDKVNGVFTSPPYAMQRKDQYGGVPTAEYVDWWEALQANVKANLASDGSFFVNIKAHCEDGQRVLYCMDLVAAMVRRWGWRFVDELCWVRPNPPGEWPNRFKNHFEPVYHFSGDSLKFRPKSVTHKSHYSRKGSGGSPMLAHEKADLGETFYGDALPSNVLEMGGESGRIHPAAFPVALPDFFIRAYSDPGDVWCDPFCGSGTTILAAHNNKRRGLGIEQTVEYCAVILQRLTDSIPGIEIERITTPF